MQIKTVSRAQAHNIIYQIRELVNSHSWWPILPTSGEMIAGGWLLLLSTTENTVVESLVVKWGSLFEDDQGNKGQPQWSKIHWRIDNAKAYMCIGMPKISLMQCPPHTTTNRWKSICCIHFNEHDDINTETDDTQKSNRAGRCRESTELLRMKHEAAAKLKAIKNQSANLTNLIRWQKWNKPSNSS